MNTQIIEITQIDGSVVEYIIIDRGNGEFTSMLKSIYDEQQAHLQTIVTPGVITPDESE